MAASIRLLLGTASAFLCAHVVLSTREGSDAHSLAETEALISVGATSQGRLMSHQMLDRAVACKFPFGGSKPPMEDTSYAASDAQASGAKKDTSGEELEGEPHKDDEADALEAKQDAETKTHSTVEAKEDKTGEDGSETTSGTTTAAGPAEWTSEEKRKLIEETPEDCTEHQGKERGTLKKLFGFGKSAAQNQIDELQKQCQDFTNLQTEGQKAKEKLEALGRKIEELKSEYKAFMVTLKSDHEDIKEMWETVEAIKTTEKNATA